ncbi:DUF2867 domain-containing protein [Streptomyces sp. ISL-100]|uniref:DUF2867 domain-containing protein n=1 Tax=Streptomyces sp. ISL-100 TaxID=2819173 RepID=UPI001BE93AC6|nr:DUF2867 domain-containing protein [Streptomyces sp. ISL-100]MBT2399958.1 DUF2867 domain-containing protein [Streptomyces sp. ISL-100]
MSAIRDVHERTVQAPAEVVGALLDRLSAEDDPIFPTPAWEPMRFDRPLAVGAVGGHGPVRLSVSAYEPGRHVRFTFAPPDNGFHEMTVEPLGPERCVVRHVLEQDLRGADFLLWLTVVKAVHSTVVEEVFDNIERVAAGGVERPVRWSPWVRLLNRLAWGRAVAVEIPESARLIRTAIDRPGYRDAYRMELLPGMPRDPDGWTGILRDAFPVVAREGGELLMNVDTAGVKARASILVDERHVTLSTVAKADTVRGRLYWGVVRRVHPLMARTMLRRAHRRLALAAPSAGERATAVRTVASVTSVTAVSSGGPGRGQPV